MGSRLKNIGLVGLGLIAGIAGSMQFDALAQRARRAGVRGAAAARRGGVAAGEGPEEEGVLGNVVLEGGPASGRGERARPRGGRCEGWRLAGLPLKPNELQAAQA